MMTESRAHPCAGTTLSSFINDVGLSNSQSAAFLKNDDDQISQEHRLAFIVSHH